ncbi:MAG: hypothetical protein Q9175_007704, partial [Cornicularia normoerica]
LHFRDFFSNKMSSHRKDNLGEMIAFVRNHSPHYEQSLKNVPHDATSVEDLPLVDIDAFWKANGLTPSQVMRSGGSTGTPKMVCVTKSEQKVIWQVTAVGMAEGCGLLPGDRIANLSHHGSLYGSFVIFTNILQELPIPTVLLPIGGNEGIENVAKWIEELEATVLQTNVSTLRRIAELFIARGQTLPKVRLLMYTGECFTKELRPTYMKAFPNATIYPSLYGSVDAGTFAVPERPSRGGDDDIMPVYRVLTPLAVMEIIDEDGKPIKENGKSGSVVVTHLHRRLQPLLRYPCGDIASWVDYEKETFRLHGRDAVGLKISTTHLPLIFLRETIDEVLGNGVVKGSQFVARFATGSSQQLLVCRIACSQPKGAERVCEELEARIARVSPTWVKNRSNGNIAPLQIEWISPDQLICREETGKLKNIIEERFED